MESPRVTPVPETAGRHTVAYIFLASVVYATVRYNMFKGVPWSDWPVFVLNKAFALASLAMIALFAVGKARAGGRPAPGLMSAAGSCALIHVLLSLAIFTPEYYGKLFREGRLTASAGVAMALGSVAVALMAAGARLPRDADPRRRAVLLAVLALAVGAHAALQGFAGWFTPSLWPGRLPPITLISAGLGLAGAVAALRAAGRAD